MQREISGGSPEQVTGAEFERNHRTRPSRLSRNLVRSCFVVAILATANIIIGCGSGPELEAAEGTKTPTISSVERQECPPTQDAGSNPDRDEVRDEILRAGLPGGICLFMVYSGEARNRPGMLNFQVDLTFPASNGPNDLRSVATDIAHTLKVSAISSRIAQLAVSNWGDIKAGKPRYDSYLEDANFADHIWNSSSSREEEMALWNVHIR
ncbi:hypothetical protein [Nocardia australiensis]|uniref:hypothetical protein n=1 Tax=Nocardia australiensis TaxID=2887191 RepID=UPI001D14E7F6|nr:hypothetical protein [Nocardia australiensis]